MKVLITGGCGFIGSHLCDLLLKNGHEVTALDDLSTGRFANVAHLDRDPKFHVVIDNVLNRETVDRLVRESDAVYHLASAVGV